MGDTLLDPDRTYVLVPDGLYDEGDASPESAFRQAQPGRVVLVEEREDHPHSSHAVSNTALADRPAPAAGAEPDSQAPARSKVAEYSRLDSGDSDTTPTAILFPPLRPDAVLSVRSIPPERFSLGHLPLRSNPGDATGIVGQTVTLLNAKRGVARNGHPRTRLQAGLQAAADTAAHGLRLCSGLLEAKPLGIGSLAEFTFVGRQLRMRNDQFANALEQYLQSLDGKLDRLDAHLAYLGRLNLLWLCVNDIIYGLAVGSLLRDHHAVVVAATEDLVRVYVLAYLRDLLQWLSSWPMGIKLNDEIATLICRAFLGLSNLWEHACLTPTLDHLPVGLIGACGLLGASTIFAIAADVLAFLTLPYFACYAVATFTFRQSLEALSALFDVFRGRKFNPLRNRTEPASYEVDALLLGTILFVVLSSIIPTIAAFYLAFASSRILLIGLQTLLAAAIGVLNTFPLFVLLVRLKSPHRLPGGTALRPCRDRAHWPEDHFHLEAHTMSYGTIFASLMRTTSENVSAGAIWRGLVCLCTGRVMWFRSQPRQA